MHLMHLMLYHHRHHLENSPMATTKPRITVTLSARQHEVLRIISENSGQSVSSFVSDLIEQTLPTLERMAETFRRIKAVRDDQRQRIAQELDSAHSALEPIVSQVLGQFDLFCQRVEDTAGVPPTPARAAVVGETPAPSTPATNRGVTPPPSPARKPARAKASRPIASEKVFSKPKGCTCTVTAHERQENPACPVHTRKG